MKRIILTLLGTVGGLVALLSFKTQSPLTSTAALPDRSLSGASPSTGGTTSAASNPPESSSATSAPRTSTAPAATTKKVTGDAITTRYGVVQVKVTVTGSKITDVGFVQLTAFDPRSQQINSDAAPQLLQETLDAQSANIDGVSGATYTSDGYRQSLQSALDEAGLR